MGFYSKRHWAQFRPGTDSLAQIAERENYRKAAKQAVAERQQKFPVLTAENFDQASRFQEDRIQQLLGLK